MAPLDDAVHRLLLLGISAAVALAVLTGLIVWLL
jgi:hypothetical protein